MKLLDNVAVLDDDGTIIVRFVYADEALRQYLFRCIERRSELDEERIRARRFECVVGDGMNADAVVTHNLGKRALVVDITEVSDGMSPGPYEVFNLDDNRVRVVFRVKWREPDGKTLWREYPIPKDGWRVKVIA